MWLALRAALHDATRRDDVAANKQAYCWKSNRIGKESGSATVSATGLQRLPDKKP
nr:MAG TPA: hypothetical protein [Caudoviricetes sp.]